MPPGRHTSLSRADRYYGAYIHVVDRLLSVAAISAKGIGCPYWGKICLTINPPSCRLRSPIEVSSLSPRSPMEEAGPLKGSPVSVQVRPGVRDRAAAGAFAGDGRHANTSLGALRTYSGRCVFNIASRCEPRYPPNINPPRDQPYIVGRCT